MEYMSEVTGKVEARFQAVLRGQAVYALALQSGLGEGASVAESQQPAIAPP